MLQQLKAQAAGLGLFFVGIALVGVWLGVAAFLGLQEVMHPAWAASVTGLISSVVVLLIMLVVRLKHRRKKRERDRLAEELAIPNVETLLAGLLDGSSLRLLQQNADRATLVALVLGGVAGYSDKSRKVMLSVLKGMVAALQATQSSSDESSESN
ncbi:hypothetical protein BGP77_04065 [Saccharospirillum sp. MSK14-1]|uniref:hypothetical protein n=1 Tax=Saccharospirillum sp. MSK14-1 TaxID=1897632 RepID=UPI000D36D3A5|nr:hypothetical protein [Saccharospirillum sp. MSK14-1]PTY36483.1 hypothetical protein BGP77_04065 [Saccharospirillum sp. MSK14-1]